MKKSSIFVCQKCDAQAPKWMGQCPECGGWGTLVEEVKVKSKKQSRIRTSNVKILRLRDVATKKNERSKTGIGELDRVLGGGVISGSVVLFSGEPGIGKSTLLTQIALKITQSNKKLKVVYVCGEESPEQVRLRVDRLGGKGNPDNLLLYPETNIDLIVAKVDSLNKKGDLLLIVDSIQTVFADDLSSIAGSISQVRESTQRLIELAKIKQIPVFIVGHVTKSGTLAGPKTIEHAVDTVLYFEGERSGDLRLLRSMKNRFGPTDEVGVFQMTDKGLIEVINPSSLMLDEKLEAKVGSAYTVIFEGTRPMVVEIQALVTKSFAPLPKRVVNGLDRRRSEMLVAVIQKYLKLPLWQYDVFLNVAGGFKVSEPAADLAVCAAVYSSYKSKALPRKSVFVGEVSLLGEVNPVGKMNKRKKQVEALGFKKIFSSQNLKKLFQTRTLLK